jgi:flavin reductase (DIM6/NTAB) family NADH-FMN oxidoreductase RutF
VIAGHRQRDLALQVGSVRGSDTDKFKHFNIQFSAGTPKEALVPEGAAAWMACRVESSQQIPGYRLIIGRVIDRSAFETPPLVWRNKSFFTLNPV